MLSDQPLHEVLRDHGDAHWVGWSMGGLIALSALAHGILPRSLSLLAALPRMVEGDDWPCAIKRTEFANFRIRLLANPHQGLRYFATLITHGEPEAANLLQELRSAPQPDTDTLAWGLELLEGTDMRGQWAACAVPQQLVLGACDALIPPVASEHMRALQGDIPITVLENAGHTLPLSCPRRCAEVLCNFWSNLP